MKPRHETGETDRHYLDHAVDNEIDHWVRYRHPKQTLAAFELEHILHRIDLHNVGPFLSLKTLPKKMPKRLARPLRDRLVSREIWEAHHKMILEKALDALFAAELNPLVMKGTALAYSHYERPAFRPRGDSDILIESKGRERAVQALLTAGFETYLTAGGEHVTSEAIFFSVDTLGHVHSVDLHWRLNSSPVVAQLFEQSELFEHSLELTNLHPSARRFSDIHALLFAAVHRSLHIDRPTHTHLAGSAYDVVDNLNWLRDIDILFQSLNERERQNVVLLADQKGIADIFLGALVSAQQRLGTNVDEKMIAVLDTNAEGAISKYVSAGAFSALLMNLKALSGWKRRFAFLSELLFPSTAYMRERFSSGHIDYLPILYFRRFLQGARKLMLRSWS